MLNLMFDLLHKFTEKYFKEMLDLKMTLQLPHPHHVGELSMGMSNDYLKAIQYRST